MEIMNYNESGVMGNEYTRCSQIVISNPLGQTPAIQFYEDKVLNLGNRQIIESAGMIQTEFDIAKTINIVNPVTGEPTGQTISYGEVFAIIFSAYLAEAEAKGNQAVEE